MTGMTDTTQRAEMEEMFPERKFIRKTAAAIRIIWWAIFSGAVILWAVAVMAKTLAMITLAAAVAALLMAGISLRIGGADYLAERFARWWLRPWDGLWLQEAANAFHREYPRWDEFVAHQTDDEANAKSLSHLLERHKAAMLAEKPDYPFNIELDAIGAIIRLKNNDAGFPLHRRYRDWEVAEECAALDAERLRQ